MPETPTTIEIPTEAETTQAASIGEAALGGTAIDPAKELTRIKHSNPEGLEEKIEEFKKIEQIGVMINDQQDKIDEIIASINAQVIPGNKPLDTTDSSSLKARWSDLLIRNGFGENDIIFEKLDTERDVSYAQEVVKLLIKYSTKLELLAYTLYQRRDLTLGKSVTLHPQPTEKQPHSEPESGWSIYTITLAGNLRLLKPKDGSGSFVGVPNKDIPYNLINTMLPKAQVPVEDDDGYVTVR
jgi:hypothetical protein